MACWVLWLLVFDSFDFLAAGMFSCGMCISGSDSDFGSSENCPMFHTKCDTRLCGFHKASVACETQSLCLQASASLVRFANLAEWEATPRSMGILRLIPRGFCRWAFYKWQLSLLELSLRWAGDVPLDSGAAENAFHNATFVHNQ